MPLQLPSLNELCPDKGSILALAAQALPTLLHTEATTSAQRAKIAAFRSYQEHVTTGLHGVLRDAIQQAVELHELMEGERADADDPAAWDAAIDAAVAESLSNIAELAPDGFKQVAQGVRFDEPGRPDDVAKDLAAIVARCEPYHAHMEDHGKLLARIGIVAADLEGLAALGGDGTPTPPPPPVAPPVVAAAPPPPAETNEEINPNPVDMRPPPAVTEIAKAYALMYQAAGLDAADMAKRLGVSRNTFVNYCTGKTSPKCPVPSAQYLQAYCVKAAADLTEAADIFSRVR